jgi:putative salt-induced outer membrane protein
LLDDSFQVTDTTLWTNRLLVESGSDNTFTQFNTALAVAMNAKLSLSLGFEVRHNSDVPQGVAENTDTVTTANLVYNF